MIEAPEALCLSEQLNGVIKGKVVMDVIPCYTSHKFAFFNGDPEKYPGMLLGKMVDGACAYGGMVQINVRDAKVVFSDGAVHPVRQSDHPGCIYLYGKPPLLRTRGEVTEQTPVTDRV